MKGLVKLKEKLPDYQGKKLRLFQVIAFSSFIISLVFQLIMDSLPRIFPDIAILQLIAPLTPIIGSLIVLLIGLTIVCSFWKIRDKYLSKYGVKAYQKAFRFVAANPAESPAGPPPNTKTSVSAIIGVFLDGSSIHFTIYYLYTKI